MRVIDLKSWKRKEHFEFFSKMTNPYFGFVTEVDCTLCYQNAKAKGASFFASYLHKSLLAVNAVEEFKYRILGDEVVCINQVNAEMTVIREDETFGFLRMNFTPDFKAFNAELQQGIEDVQNSTGLRLGSKDLKDDVIHYSSIPWNSFSGLLHPTNLDNPGSIPKIVFGKFIIRDNKKMMPVSIEAHHGLLDGFHLAKFVNEFQKQLDLD